MSDFYVHHLDVTGLDSASSVTLTEGTDYTLQAATPAANRCIALISSIQRTGTPRSASVGPQDFGVHISYSTDITASLTLNREGSTGTCDTVVTIIEYVGDAGGANEFINRGVGTIAMSAVATGSSGTISGVVSDADMVPFLTGASGDTGAGANGHRIYGRLEWDAANNEIDATRTQATNLCTYSYAAVEFTGSNWTVQKGNYTVAAAGSTQTTTMPDQAVADITKTFLEAHFHPGGSAFNLDDVGAHLWITGTNELSAFQRTGADLGTWYFSVIENSDASFKVTRYNHDMVTSAVENDTITAVDATTTTSLHGICGWVDDAGTSAVEALHQVAARLSSTTNVELERAATTYDIDVRYEVVEWLMQDTASSAVVTVTALGDIQ